VLTELSWLVQLLLNDLLPKELKELVAHRIQEVEARYTKPTIVVPPSRPIEYNPTTYQSPSTQAILDKDINPIQQVVAPTVIASQAAAQAINARQQAINEAMSGKPLHGATSPTKFHGQPK